MKLLILLLLAGCASAPLTPLEEIEREMAEQERVEHFLLWEAWCKRNGIMVINNSWSCSSARINRGCVPDRNEWKFSYRDMPDGSTRIRVLSHTYACIKR